MWKEVYWKKPSGSQLFFYVLSFPGAISQSGNTCLLWSHCKCWIPEIKHQRWYLNVEMKIPQSFTHAKLLQPSVISVGAVAAQRFESQPVRREVLRGRDRCWAASIVFQHTAEPGGGETVQFCSSLQHCWADGNLWATPPARPWHSESSLAPALHKIVLCPLFLKTLSSICQCAASYKRMQAAGLWAEWQVVPYLICGAEVYQTELISGSLKSFSICCDYKENSALLCMTKKIETLILVFYQWMETWCSPLLKMALFLNATCIKKVTKRRRKK